MKRIILFLLFVQIFLLVACKPEAPEPVNPDDDIPVQNNIDNSWSYDAESHWHDQSDLALHDWKETIIKEATYDEDGSTLCTCTVCGYEKTKIIAKLSHTHTFSDEWSHDSGFHWHAATCGHEDERKDEEEHDWLELEDQAVVPTKLTTGKKVYVCSVCGESKTEVVPDLAPDTISNFQVVSTEKQCVTVKWKNPSDSDFAKVVIAYGEDKKVEIPGLPGEEVTKSFLAMENGTLYVFKIIAVDNNENYSLPIEENVPVYGGLYKNLLNNVNPGNVISSNLFNLVKTSEVAIIPHKSEALFGIPDNSSWNGYFPENDETIPDNYKGAFVKGRKIRLSSFAMGQYNVTEELWDRVMVADENSRRHSKVPVTNITYGQACIFCNELNKLIYGDTSYCVYYIDKELTELYTEENCHPPATIYDYELHQHVPYIDPETGDVVIDYSLYKPVYPNYNYTDCKWNTKGYRLPTEAEWEYAARGGNPNAPEWRYAFAGVQYPYMMVDRSKIGSSDERYKTEEGIVYRSHEDSVREYAWYNYNNENKPIQEVGLLKPNTLNLYDMSGNTEEYLFDGYLTDVTSNDNKYMRGGYVTNPIGGEMEDYVVGRSYLLNSNGAIEDTVSYRNQRYTNYGRWVSFRLARSLD